MYISKPHVAGDRGLSHELWNLARLRELQVDPAAGFFFFDDFLDLPTGKYTATQATAGTFALIDGDGGIVEADSASTTDTQGITVQGVAEWILPEAKSEIWAETRLKIHDFGTDGGDLQFFWGLAVEDGTLIATSANSTDNHVGFEGIATNVLDFVSEKATARGTIADVATVVDSDVTANSWIKLGFHIIGLDAIEVWVNGVKYGTEIATANIPIVEMTPSLVVQVDGAGDGDPLAHIDWWAFAKSHRIG